MSEVVTSHDKSWGAVPFLISFGVFTLNWIWSVVDAVISANNINSEAKLKKHQSTDLDKLKYGFSFDKNKGMNLKFALEL